MLITMDARWCIHGRGQGGKKEASWEALQVSQTGELETWIKSVAMKKENSSRVRRIS